MMLIHNVRTTLGVCEVTLKRGALDLDERGGFSARWLEGDAETAEAMGLEDYRLLVRAYLQELYSKRHGRAPGNVVLNLASHQLIDDIAGWAKLNWRP